MEFDSPAFRSKSFHIEVTSFVTSMYL